MKILLAGLAAIAISAPLMAQTMGPSSTTTTTTTPPAASTTTPTDNTGMTGPDNSMQRSDNSMNRNENATERMDSSVNRSPSSEARSAQTTTETTLVERDGKWWNGDRQATESEISAYKKAQKMATPR